MNILSCSVQQHCLDDLDQIIWCRWDLALFSQPVPLCVNELWPFVQAKRHQQKHSAITAGCNNICHNYPENINISAPGSAGLPGQSEAGGAAVTPCSGHDAVCQKHQGVLSCLFGLPHKLSRCIFNDLETFFMSKSQHRVPVGVFGCA